MGRQQLAVAVAAEGPEQPDGWSMQGQPVTRTSSSDGSWTFTLYRSREYPFIHALPLGQGAWAACIELPEAWNGRVSSLRLRMVPGDHALEVLDAHGAVVATADVEHWKVSLAQPAASS